MNRLFFLISLLFVLYSCTPTPHDVKETSEALVIYPEYQDVTIPANIAPLNFMLRNEQVEAVSVSVEGVRDAFEFSSRGRKVIFEEVQWHSFLSQEKGNKVTVTVTALLKGEWYRYPSFTWIVAEEPIDGYLTYRLIEPGFEVWHKIQIEERSLESFETKSLAHHEQLNNQCMNCHIHGGNKGQYSLFHLRGENGGTILNREGRLRKLNLRNAEMAGGAVYGDIHPSGRYGVFSTNEIIPSLHTTGNRRLEVFDTKSDLCIADFDDNRMILSPVVADSTRLETFPCFSSDGKYVYYCGAPLVQQPDSTKNIRYSICRIAFDDVNGKWGEKVDTIWNARLENGSASFPKMSPDGRYLLFTRSDYGTFPIWHRESDLYMINMQTQEMSCLTEANSNRSDTYHSWSSNSKWIAFASKRGDGQYGRVYFAYVSQNGKVHKAFVLPQADPEIDDLSFKSYNIPDLSATSVPFSTNEVKTVFRSVKSELFE